MVTLLTSPHDYSFTVNKRRERGFPRRWLAWDDRLKSCCFCGLVWHLQSFVGHLGPSLWVLSGQRIQFHKHRKGSKLCSAVEGIFLPESTFSVGCFTVSTQPSCAIACIDICVHVKDPMRLIVNIRIPAFDVHSRCKLRPPGNVSFQWTEVQSNLHI